MDSTAKIPSNRPIAVIGAGTLGRRIALMFATRGGLVRVHSRSAQRDAEAAAFIDERLPKLAATIAGGTPGKVEFDADLAKVVADAWLVVESVPEQLELKRELFADLDRLAPADAILATNSSSYPSSRMIDQVQHPERVLNLHFFMPPEAPAVELMSCGHTDPAIIERLMQALPAFGLTPFLAQRESMGFIYNRIWAAIKREALAVVAEGVAAPADVDRLFTMVLRAPLGPFLMMDWVGLDVVLDIENNYAAALPGIPQGPRELLRRYIADGRLGMKSGRGFYDDYSKFGVG